MTLVQKPSRRFVDEEGSDQEHEVPHHGKDEHDLPDDVVFLVLCSRCAEVDCVAKHGSEVDGDTVD